MNVLRALLASLMSLICTLAVSAYVTLQTLESTILNKEQVKTWLHDSNIYDDLFPALVSADQTVEQQTANASSTIVTKDTIQTALNKTFDTNYVQAQTEKVVDSTYGWLNGANQSITFDVNTTEKKQSFIDNLAALLEPQLASLPQCASYSEFDSTNPTCLPPGATAKTASQSLAVDAANSTTFFTQPITNETVAAANQQSGTNASESPLTGSAASSNNLPQIIKNVEAWGAWLPLVALVGGGLCVALSRNRFKASKHLAGRLTIGLGITALLGLGVAYLGKTVSIANYASNSFVTTIIDPVLRQALPAVGYRLALVSGGIGLLTGTIWLTLQIIKKRRDKAQLLKPIVDSVPPPTPMPPAQPPAATPPADSQSDK